MSCGVTQQPEQVYELTLAVPHEQTSKPALIAVFEATEALPATTPVEKAHRILTERLSTYSVDISVINDRLHLSVPSEVLFDIDKHQIKSRGEMMLHQLANVAEKDSQQYIKIIGHTDSTGTEAYNLTLSGKRASAVRQYLLENGVSSYRLSSIAMGESKSVADNATDEGKRMNRRVELVIFINTIPE